MLHLNKADIDVLWDNFKRDVNHNLNKIRGYHSLNKRYAVFNYPPYEELQGILVKTGKWLHKAAIAYHLREGKNDLKDFDFYFWPGYDTWKKGQRVFIAGSLIKGRKNQKRYLSGIGASKITGILDEDRFKSFLLGSEREFYSDRSYESAEKQEESLIHEFISFEGDEFYYHDNPSTYAFDQVLNPLHPIESENQSSYLPGSTHHWKANQVDEKGRFISLRLKDGSELRSLHIQMKDKYKVKGGSGILTISIPKNGLELSGNFISRCLSLQNLPLQFDGTGHEGRIRGRYIPWPSSAKSIEHHPEQVNAYSFWIAETLRSQTSNEYTRIKERFQKKGLDLLADRIVPFEKAQKLHDELASFRDTRFSHWYTLFFESFADVVDLGSAMFLCSHPLHKTHFLRDATNQIRWLFQELRILEVNAQIEWERSWQDITVLRHSQRHYIQASRATLEYATEQNFEAVRDTLEVCNTLLSGYLDIAKIIESPKGYIEHQKIDGRHEVISLSKICQDHLAIFSNILQNPRISESTIRHKSIKSPEYAEFMLPLIEHSQVKIDEDFSTEAPEYLIALIIKELLINALENVDIHNPQFGLSLKRKENAGIEMTIYNSVPQYVIEDNFETLQKIHRGETLDNKRLGWNVIKELIKALRYPFESTHPKDMKNTGVFTYKIVFPEYG